MNLEVGSGKVSLFLVYGPLVLVFAAHKIVESFSHFKSRRQTGAIRSLILGFQQFSNLIYFCSEILIFELLLFPLPVFWHSSVLLNLLCEELKFSLYRKNYRFTCLLL